MQINPSLLNDYFKSIKKEYSTRNYTELSFRTSLENFIHSLNKDFQLHQEQKRVRGVGAPDFKAFRKAVNVGYIETKDLGANLDDIIKTEQIQKYVQSINNLILTNYTRFILIRSGERVFDTNIFDVTDLDKKDININEDSLNRFQKLIDNFFSYSANTINSPSELAKELSKKARLLKEIAKDQLEEDLKRIEEGETPSPVYGFYIGIKEMIQDITIDNCADAYAQTITYGIFLAKTNYLGQLERENLVNHIPESNGLIRRIFMNIIFDKISHLGIVWIIEDIIDILNASNLKKILSDIDERGKKDKDPFLFFYEDFLESYDPEKRKHFGEYYTPRPVVNFIVNVTNQILKDDFSKQRGLAEDSVKVLDPAVGTGTFLWITYLLNFKELKDNGLGGLINQKIKNHVLKDYYGFEISITSYIIAHLKLTTLLERWGYWLKDDERIQVYLTNTLEKNEIHGLLPFMQELSEEAIKAGIIKDKPILAIIGNPPYHGISANNGKWIDNLLREGYTRSDKSKDDGYYKVDGKPLGEKKLWLQDDYVKFIRFGQWKLDKSGEGILAFINNHGYIDTPTFRGMRYSLLQSFGRIYILNLHGNSRKKEKCPDGSKDENVFDIQQGVTINIFVKNNRYKDKKVFYADIWGTRKFKFEWLDRFSLDSSQWLKTINWQEVKPKSPNYYFVPTDYSLEGEWDKFWEITDIFPIYVSGIVSARDNFVIDLNKDVLKLRIEKFRDVSILDHDIKQTFKLKDTTEWKLSEARKRIAEDKNWDKHFTEILYRPFDIREIYYTPLVVHRTRLEIMRHMVSSNLGIVFTRPSSPNYEFSVLVSEKIVDQCTIGNKSMGAGNTYIAPLFLYS